MSINCCDKCSANISTAASNTPGGWSATTFASIPSKETTDNAWEMPATPDYNNLTWFGTSELGACDADWEDCSKAGQQFAGFQDNMYGSSNNGVQTGSGCAQCITGKHVLCSSNQINTCPGVEVFGDGGLSNNPAADLTKIVYGKTTDNKSFPSTFPRGKTTCRYPKDVVQTPLQMRTITQLIANGKIDPIVGDALATEFCTQVVTSTTGPPPAPTCRSMIPLHTGNTPAEVFNYDTVEHYYGNPNTYTGFVGEYVPWTTLAAAKTAEAAAAAKGKRVLWVFGPLTSMAAAGFGGYNALWSSITGPPLKAYQFNDTPSYGIMVSIAAAPDMAAFKLNMSSIPIPSVTGSAVVSWAVSNPNQIDTEFTAIKWTEPPVVFYAPPLDSAPICNSIEFAVSTMFGVAPNITPSFDPTQITQSVLWGRSIASDPIPPVPGELCTTSPVTGFPMNKCSRFRAAGEGGDACRAWATSRKVSGINTSPDKAYDEYCNSNSANPDCDCLKRNEAIGSTNQVIREHYQAMAGSGLPVPDTCWYIPCKDNDGNYSVVTESILNPDPPNKTCPDNVCMEVVQAWAKRDANVNNIDLNMDCKTQYTDYVDNKYACDDCTVAQPAPTKESPNLKKGYPTAEACKSACGGGGGGGGALSAGAIAGIVVACVVVVGVVILLIALRKPPAALGSTKV
jgi:hypothetical protein